jgi:hypothetical protein
VLQPVATSTTVTLRDGSLHVQDGPFADTKEQLGGVFIIDVPDLDAALAWAEKCPAAQWGTIEIRPTAVHFTGRAVAGRALSAVLVNATGGRRRSRGVLRTAARGARRPHRRHRPRRGRSGGRVRAGAAHLADSGVPDNPRVACHRWRDGGSRRGEVTCTRKAAVPDSAFEADFDLDRSRTGGWS